MVPQRPPGPARSRPRLLALVMVVSAVTAVAARAALILTQGGLGSLQTYDDGVYYAGADALLHGRLPYADFLFLHPPGILLALAPFAELGRLTSDPLGLSAARVGFWVLGGLNAALAARVAARQGLLAATVAGLGYALWFPARYGERTAILGGPGSTAILVALLLLGRTGRPPGRRDQLLAGAALGLATCVKLWMVVPLAVVVVWQLLEVDLRAAVRTALGAAAAMLVVVAPFLGAAPAMFRMVVADQLSRADEPTAAHVRLLSLTGLRPLLPDLAPAPLGALVALVVAVLVLCSVAALRRPATRVHVALLVATLAVLMTTPSFYQHYGVYAAAPLVLVLGTGAAAAHDLVRSRPRARAPRLVAVGAALGLGALLVVQLTTLTRGVGSPFPAARLRPAVAGPGCVVSDDPGTLALLDVLSRDLGRGCPLWVDPTGLTYGAAKQVGPDGVFVPRARNEVWQAALGEYLASGAAIVVRTGETGVGPRLRRDLAERPVLGRAGRYRVVGPPG